MIAQDSDGPNEPPRLERVDNEEEVDMKTSVFLGALIVAGLSAGAVFSGTLDDVKTRGKLNCGVASRLVGFAAQDENGEWQGFDVAMCRAVAAAVLGDQTAVEFVPSDGEERFVSLATGKVDLLTSNTTWTFSRDVGMKFDYIGINYYDGQGFLVPKALGFSSAKDLNGETLCVQAGSTSEANLAEYFRKNNMSYTAVPVKDGNEGKQKYLSGACNAYSTDMSALASARATFENPSDHVLLPEIISKEPLAPLVRHGENEWADVARWTLNALIAAEELGITSANIGELSSHAGDSPEVNRLLGTEGDLGAQLGLEADWAKRAIMAGGNYGEIFEKNIGENSPIGLARGLNAQWIDGGLLYSPPFR